MLETILENKLINSLAGGFSRSALQKNLLHESDSEIISLYENSGELLALTIDSVAEEIKTGLYNNPYLIGWMIVMVNFSDIAAVGAEPLGILISEILPENISQDFIQKLQKGINEAVGSCRSFVLGGDTNHGSETILTGCALGRVPVNKILKRTGCSAGDILFSTGKLGRGNAFALSKFFPGCEKEFIYLPEAKLKEALIIREFASACIDTSDGAISALDQIMRLNNHGFYLNQDTENILDRESMEICKARGISPWLLLAGEHGEFELLFTVPYKKENDFLSAASEKNWEPVRVGIVLEEPELKLNLYGKKLSIDSGRIRNLPYDSHGNIEIYIKKLLQYDKELLKSC